MRFYDFLRVTVLISAGAATALAAVTLAGLADGSGDAALGPVAAGWWIAAVVIGLWVGWRHAISPAIASLLAGARTQASLPEVNPARTVLNRLWPLIGCTLGAAGVGFVVPQVPAIATGFAIIWALAWRRQSAAVRAVEDRDGARFYVDRTSPLEPIRLVRTPGLRAVLQDRLDEAPTPVSRRG